MVKNYDFVAIGDIVVDAFIELEDAKVTCDVDHEACTISMRFGDKIPYKKLSIIPGVGNSPNAAVAASRLGLKTALVSDIGSDQFGKDCKKSLKHNKVETRFLSEHSGIPTNYHFVLRYDAERTILVKHESYPYKFPMTLPPPKWMYLSSVGSGTEAYHESIVKYLERHPKVKLAFQPGTFQMKIGTKKLSRLYKRTEIFFCNKEEARRILDLPHADFKELLEGIRSLGPNIVVITDGPRGLTMYDGTDMYYLPMYPDPKPPLERTGAGDATSSTITAYLAMGFEPIDAFMRGPINSMNVVQHIGAQEGLLDKNTLEKLFQKRPKHYKPEKL